MKSCSLVSALIKNGWTNLAYFFKCEKLHGLLENLGKTERLFFPKDFLSIGVKL